MVALAIQKWEQTVTLRFLRLWVIDHNYDHDHEGRFGPNLHCPCLKNFQFSITLSPGILFSCRLLGVRSKITSISNLKKKPARIILAYLHISAGNSLLLGRLTSILSKQIRVSMIDLSMSGL